MAGKRAGTSFGTAEGGPRVVEAPGAYSLAQAIKVKRPKARANKSSIDRGDDGANTPREGRGASGIGGKRPRAPSWEREYQQIWKSVYDLGAEQFTGKDKRAYEARKIVEMGGRAPKQATMPYVMLQGIRKKAKQRQEQREAMEAEAGLVTGTRKSERRKSGQASRKRSGGDGRASRTRSDRGGASVGPAPSAGMLKSGVLHVSRKAVPRGDSQHASESGRVAGLRYSGGGGDKGRFGTGRRKGR